MGNKSYIVVEDETGKRSRIVPKTVEKKFERFQLETRNGSGYHDSRPKRERTRGAALRRILENY